MFEFTRKKIIKLNKTEVFKTIYSSNNNNNNKRIKGVKQKIFAY